VERVDFVVELGADADVFVVPAFANECAEGESRLKRD